MGVTITATNSKYSFEMGAGGFFNLRANIADALDKEFGEHYRSLLNCHYSDDYKLFNKIANAMLARKRLDEDIVAFLFMPDTTGNIPHKTCKKIFDLIKNIDYTGKGFQYAAYQNKDYEQFKKFLKECYFYRRKMRWY